MSDTFYIKQNDNRPNLRTVLSGFNGGTSLSSASSVSFKMRHRGSGSVVSLAGTCSITDAPNNIVTYAWDTADTASIDTYEAEFQINWNDGGIETVPNDGYNYVIVKDDIS